MSYERLIGYFDILGFRKKVMEAPLEVVVQDFTKLLSALLGASVRLSFRSGDSILDIESKYGDAPPSRESNPGTVLNRDTFKAETGFDLIVMSDSIVLYSGVIKQDDANFGSMLSRLGLLSRVLLKNMFECVLPARGSLTYGEFYVDEIGGIYCGKGLVEAIEVSESQDWIGEIICEPLEPGLTQQLDGFRAESWAAALGSEAATNYLRPKWDVVKYPVPFKAGAKLRWVVNWASDWNAAGLMRDDCFEDVLTGEPSVDAKYANTLKFLKTWHNGGFV